MAHKTKGFGELLEAAGQARGRLCVGIDPHPYLLEKWGLEPTADGLRTFSMRCVEAFSDTAALVKPQVAFFERFGSQGRLGVPTRGGMPDRGRCQAWRYWLDHGRLRRCLAR